MAQVSQMDKTSSRGSELEKIIDQADKCPQCNFEWPAMFNKQAKRIEKELEPKLPKNFTVDWQS